MKLGGIVRCYHLTEYLEKVLKSLDYLDIVLLQNYRFKGVPETIDDTEEIFKKLNQKNIILKTGHGEEQHILLNKGLDILADCDFVFINDADEFITKTDRDYMVDFLVNNSYDGGTCNVIDYKDTGNIYEERTHKPTVVVKPSVRFHETRGAAYSNYFFHNINMHHFGFALKEMNWKNKNLYYRRSSFDEVICRKNRPYQMPEEIRRMIDE